LLSAASCNVVGIITTYFNWFTSTRGEPQVLDLGRNSAGYAGISGLRMNQKRLRAEDTYWSFAAKREMEVLVSVARKDNLGGAVLEREVLMRSIKELIRSLVPPPILQAWRRFRLKHGNAQYKALTAQQVFTKIYEEGTWGKPDDPSQQFYSGSGSHAESVAGVYVDAILAFLSTFEARPNVVDLGCGDFHVGSQVRFLCERYIACDIVEPLIMFNKEKYKSLDVDFRVLDITRDALPRADTVFVRQVLQHLSNKQILTILTALPQISATTDISF
jgi:hypothetical protein